MSEQIQLSIKVDAGKATGDLKRFGQTAKTEMQSVQATSTTSLSTVSRQTQTVGQRFAGAGAAISAANASLQLMGRQGPPALQTLAAGAASVAISGFGPLSIAIVGVTTALSLFLAQGDNVAKKVLSIETAAKSLAERLGDARKQLDLLVLHGGSVSAQREAFIDIAERQVARLESRAETLRTLYALANAQGSNQINPFTGEAMSPSGALEALQIEQRRLQAAKDRLRLLKDEHEVLGQIHTERAKAAAREKAALSGGRAGASGGVVLPGGSYSLDAERVLSRRELIDQMLSEGNRGRSVLEDRANRLGTGDNFFGDLDQQMREQAERDALADRLRLQREGLTFAKIWGLEEGGETQAASPSADALARANTFSQNLASSFSQALISQDYSGVGRAMALSFVDQMLQALAAGAIEAAGVKGAATAAFSAIGSVFGGGAPSETGAAATGAA